MEGFTEASSELETIEKASSRSEAQIKEINESIKEVKDEIKEIKAEIKAIQNNNPNWTEKTEIISLIKCKEDQIKSLIDHMNIMLGKLISFLRN